VTDELPALLPGAAAVYACGPMAMLRAVGSLAAEHGLDAWLTVEEAMACGIGVCMTCVLPVRQDGATRMRRSCVAGPTFASSEIRWDAVRLDAFGARSLVPDDCVGAPGGGH